MKLISDPINFGPCSVRYLTAAINYSPEDFKELVNLGISVKERTLVDHLDKDAGYAPNVDGAGVTLGAKQNLWRSVPQSHHLAGGREGGREGGGEGEDRCLY